MYDDARGEYARALELTQRALASSRAMLPRSGPERRRGLKVCALSTGLGDKAVSLLYESLLHQAPSRTWIEAAATPPAQYSATVATAGWT